MPDNSTTAFQRLKSAFDKLIHLPRALGLVWAAGKRWTVASLALLLIEGLLPVCLVYLTKAVVDSLVLAVNAKGDWSRVSVVIFYAAFMAGILLLSEILRSASHLVRKAQAERLEDYIRDLIHQKSIVADLAFYEQPEYYDHLHRARDESFHRPQELMSSIYGLLQNGVTLLAMGAVLIPFGLWLPVALFLSTLPAFFVVLRFTLKQHEWRRQATVDERRTWYYDWLLTSNETAAELRLFSLGERFRAQYQRVRARLRNEKLKLAINQSLAELFAGILALAIVCAALVWMFWRVVKGQNTLGDLALFYQAFNQGQRLMRTLLENVGQLYANSLFLGDLFEYLSLKPKIVNEENAKRPSLDQGIAFENVTFSYSTGNRFALKNFNLTIPANTTVAIVGSNGAGKSTLVKLLCRFYDPDEGSIKIDGADLRELSLDQLRKMITALFQEPVHYSATVAENVAHGNIEKETSQQEIKRASVAAGADLIVLRLPNAYEQMLGNWFPEGTELSVGEWQRIALARAYLRESPIVLLDEPTSAMDPWAETDWLQKFRALVQNRTAIIITHRFTTAMYADIIHVMDEGRIIESGSHQELLALGGRYAASWQAQTNEKKAAGV
jgi:ATP-binding cassette subfamily B protein